MNRKFQAALIVSLMVPLSACVSDSGSSTANPGVTPGRATMDQIEQACVNRLAQDSQVSPSQIVVTNSTGSSEGSAVFLNNYNGAPWICRADPAGNITSLEFQGEG